MQSVGNDPAEPLEWGLVQEVAPAVHQIWNLSTVYMIMKKYTPIVNLCEQCHDLLISKTISANIRPDGDSVRSLIASDVSINSLITLYWPDYLENVPLFAPINRMTRVLCDIYVDYSAALAHVYGGLMSVFHLNKYESVGNEILGLIELVDMCDVPAIADSVQKMSSNSIVSSVPIVESHLISSVKTHPTFRSDKALLFSYIYCNCTILYNWSFHDVGRRVQLLYSSYNGLKFLLHLDFEYANVDVFILYIRVLAELGYTKLCLAYGKDLLTKYPFNTDLLLVLSLILLNCLILVLHRLAIGGFPFKCLKL